MPPNIRNKGPMNIYLSPSHLINLSTKTNINGMEYSYETRVHKDFSIALHFLEWHVFSFNDLLYQMSV